MNNIIQHPPQESDTIDIRSNEVEDAGKRTADDIYTQLAAILSDGNIKTLKKKVLLEKMLAINDEPPPEKNDNHVDKKAHEVKHHPERILHAKELVEEKETQEKEESADRELEMAIEMLEKRIQVARVKEERQRKLEEEKKREEEERREYKEVLYLLRKVLEEQ